MKREFFECAAGALPDICFERPIDLGIILGSGWGKALVMDRVITRVNYQDIPGLGDVTVPGHTGEFVLYEREGRRIAAWCGRRHYYEGVGWEPVVLPIEILRRMAAPRVLLTNASGGINPALHPGDFVIIRDHLNTIGDNPLIGAYNPEWGARFPDMTELYAKRLSELLHPSANRLDLRVMDGVYAYTTGPVFETPAEIHSFKAQGADIVGMSTVPEAIFAHACGLQVAGLSLVSNLAAGISRNHLNHEEVLAAGAAYQARMSAFIDDFINRL